MPTVQELYELWATEAYTELKESLEQSAQPRSTASLLQTFAELGPQPDQLVLDIGARDASGAIRLVRAHGLRAIALDPVPLHCERARQAIAESGLEDRIEVIEGAIEAIPLADSSVDIARLDRRRPELVERYGEVAVDVARNGFLWGINLVLGKLRSVVYVWERRA
jgi:predicted O-methyltransferase YrrM